METSWLWCWAAYPSPACKGSVWGSIIGVLFYGVLSAGFTQLNLSTYVQWVIMGVIMVTALSIDVLKERGIKLWKKK